jgi:hypothetical protein
MCLNLSVTYVEPQCGVPSAITFSDITDSASTVSWTAGGTETAWNLEYGPTGFVQGEGTVVAVDATAVTETGISYALTGLSSGTTYDVYVQADCGDGLTSGYVGPSSFTTSPGCGDTITDTQQNSDVTTYSVTATEGNYVYVTIVGGFETCCDSIVVTDSQGITVNDQTTGIFYGDAGEGVTFMADETATVTISNDGSVLGTNGSGADVILTFRCAAPPSCFVPDDVTAIATDISAEVSWTAGQDETSWEYQVVTTGTDPAETGTVTGDNPLTVTDLSPETSYDFYIRAICDVENGDYSDWVLVSFTTLCETFTAPYSHGFEDLSCWTNSNSAAAWALDAGTDYGPGSVTEGASSVFFNDYDYSSGQTSDLMSPSIDLSALTVPY